MVDFRCRGAAALPLQDGPMDPWTDGPPATFFRSGEDMAHVLRLPWTSSERPALEPLGPFPVAVANGDFFWDQFWGSTQESGFRRCEAKMAIYSKICKVPL